MSNMPRIPYCYGDIPGLQYTIPPMAIDTYLATEEKYFGFLKDKQILLRQNEVTGLLPRLRSSLENWKLWNSGDSFKTDKANTVQATVDNNTADYKTKMTINYNKTGEIASLEDIRINNDIYNKNTEDDIYSKRNLHEAGDGSVMKDVNKQDQPPSSSSTTTPTVDNYPAYLNPFDDQFIGNSSTKEQKRQTKSSRILKSLRKVLSRPFKMCLNKI